MGGSFSDRVDVSRGSWMARSVGLIGRHGKAALRRLLRLSMLVVCGRFVMDDRYDEGTGLIITGKGTPVDIRRMSSFWKVLFTDACLCTSTLECGMWGVAQGVSKVR